MLITRNWDNLRLQSWDGWYGQRDGGRAEGTGTSEEKHSGSLK